MNNYIETIDIFGASVTCSQYHWDSHVAAGAHSIMKNNKSAVIDTLKSPEAVYKSSKNDDRKIYFKKSSFSTYNSNYFYTKVIVGYTSEDTGEIVTAFPVNGIKGGISDVIYTQQN
jgi:hypothetical protein